MAFPTDIELYEWRKERINQGVAPAMVDAFIARKKKAQGKVQESVSSISDYISKRPEEFSRLSVEDQALVYKELEKRGYKLGGPPPTDTPAAPGKELYLGTIGDGTEKERAKSAASAQLRKEARRGIIFEDAMRRYSDVLPAWQIRQLYNTYSIYGPAEESEAKAQQMLKPSDELRF